MQWTEWVSRILKMPVKINRTVFWHSGAVMGGPIFGMWCEKLAPIPLKSAYKLKKSTKWAYVREKQADERWFLKVFIFPFFFHRWAAMLIPFQLKWDSHMDDGGWRWRTIVPREKATQIFNCREGGGSHFCCYYFFIFSYNHFLFIVNVVAAFYVWVLMII